MPVAKRDAYVGLFLVALSTLMFEILLTRIFSVTMWYHFAFMAVSVALFGMTVGALIVYLFPVAFSKERTVHHLALSALWFALSVVLAFLVHLRLPFASDRSFFGTGSVALTYLVVSCPFICSGVCVSLGLTRFPRQVGGLYAADLAGAAVGCILLIATLTVIDAPSAVVLVAFLASLGSVFFAAEAEAKKLMRFAVVSAVLLGCLVVLNSFLAARNQSLFPLVWVKGKLEIPPLYEKWNSYSRITVYGDPAKLSKPIGWGLSEASPSDRSVRQLGLSIDASAETVITSFDGNLAALDYLKFDITNLAHYLRPRAKVLVVGTGGGRDILSALVFEQAAIVGVEINRDIIHVANTVFGDFTGHLDRNPKVTFVNDEARSYIARSRDMFDIIQVSFIDTWAATAAGAFALAENALYTIEGWKLFLDHLTSNGILTFSRWYLRDRPAEMYRLTALASASLRLLGVDNPEQHIVIVKNTPRDQEGPESDSLGVGTLLVSREPFSERDLSTLQQVVDELKFEVVFSPKFFRESHFAALATGTDPERVVEKLPFNVSVPTDDNPFFFFMLRFKDVFDRRFYGQGREAFYSSGALTLGMLVIITVCLTLLCVLVPLSRTSNRKVLHGALPYFIFFAAIGFAFMLIEISQLQRLVIFLGHPTYGLSIVLFSLLLSSGLGSLWTQRITGADEIRPRGSYLLFILLLAALGIFGSFTPHAIRYFEGSITPVRIVVSIALLFPLGFFMGMPFPLGMKMASGHSEPLTPWLWGINGATSVCGSVLAFAIALSSGISMTYWAGVVSYSVAFIAFVSLSGKKGVGREQLS